MAQDYDLMSQLMMMPQPGSGVLAPQMMAPMPSSQSSQVKIAEPIVAAFQRQQRFPTSAADFEELMKRRTAGLESQRAGLEDIEAQIGKLNQPTNEKNIAPILAISDFLAGTQYLKNYQSPAEKQKAAQAEALGLKLQLQKNKDALTDKEIDLYKAQYQDSFDREKLKAMTGLAQQRIDTKTEPDLKDHQVLSATYGKRIKQAEDVFSDLEKSGYNRADLGEGTKDLLSAIPGFGNLTGEDLKRQRQAERNFVTATLRKESGAAISAGEFKTAEQQYFPRAGDTPEVLAQKRANRMQVMEGMKLGAGRAWDQLSQVEPEIGAGTKMPSKTPTFEEWKKARGAK